LGLVVPRTRTKGGHLVYFASGAMPVDKKLQPVGNEIPLFVFFFIDCHSTNGIDMFVMLNSSRRPATATPA
jgi:hypothetical protein